MSSLVQLDPLSRAVRKLEKNEFGVLLLQNKKPAIFARVKLL